MEKINRSDLIDLVAEKAHLSKKDAKIALDAVVDVITDSLMNDTEVNITNFGVFTPKTRLSREGTDPKTHKKIEINERKAITFRVAKTFKEEINK